MNGCRETSKPSAAGRGGGAQGGSTAQAQQRGAGLTLRPPPRANFVVTGTQLSARLFCLCNHITLLPKLFPSPSSSLAGLLFFFCFSGDFRVGSLWDWGMKPRHPPPASEKKLMVSEPREPSSFPPANCLEAIGERAGAVGSLPAVTTCVRLVGRLKWKCRVLYNMQAGLGHHPLVP